jgi:hypothetical protein
VAAVYPAPGPFAAHLDRVDGALPTTTPSGRSPSAQRAGRRWTGSAPARARARFRRPDVRRTPPRPQLPPRGLLARARAASALPAPPSRRVRPAATPPSSAGAVLFECSNFGTVM